MIYAGNAKKLYGLSLKRVRRLHAHASPFAGIML